MEYIACISYIVDNNTQSYIINPYSATLFDVGIIYRFIKKRYMKPKTIPFQNRREKLIRNQLLQSTLNISFS